MKHFKTIIIPLLVLLAGTTGPALAQYEIGASYEIRDETPENGFGLRIERGILDGVPLVNLGVRAHFSYFSDENNVDPENATFSYSEDLSVYDFGIAATGGVSIGLMEPYVGLGLGSETTDLNIKDFEGVGSEPEEGEESNIYWNTYIGAKVTVIPVLKPFVEYRYSNKELSEPDLADSQNGRIIFGVSLSF